MVNVERIQKINNLALELMKQGLATDRESAIAQAEKIFTGKDAQEYNSMRETMQKVEAPEKPTVEEPVDLSANQISQILEKNTKYIVSQLKKFQEKILSLQQEMEALKIKMNYQKLPTVNEVRAVPKPEPNGIAQNEQKIVIEEEKQPAEPESHPRVGKFEENDVSIEKFFYMGSK